MCGKKLIIFPCLAIQANYAFSDLCCIAWLDDDCLFSFLSVLKSALTLVSTSTLGFPRNLFAFQDINFTHSFVVIVDSEEVM